MNPFSIIADEATEILAGIFAQRKSMRIRWRAGEPTAEKRGHISVYGALPAELMALFKNGDIIA